MENLSVLVIGAGAGGIAAGVAMLAEGVRELTVVDSAARIGGVWQANTYPGAQCDVPSHLYSLSFQPNPRWSRKFGDQPEILRHLEEAVARHGLTPYLRLRTEVVSCIWDDGAGRWRVALRPLDGQDGGAVQTIEADVVITATGQLSKPSIPPVPGLESFQGNAFHSARWPAGLDLTGRRVAVVGTGASAVQFVPQVVDDAEKVTVFQRSAPYVIGKPNRRYRAWEHRLYERLPWLLSASRLRLYGWHELLGVPFTRFPVLMRLAELNWRLRLHRSVRDPQLRAKLMPDYRMGCKRLLRAPDWYATVSRPDVDLVTEPIEEVLPDGVRTADGAVHPADVLIFGTGFDATRFLAPIRVVGPGGRELAEHWEHGATAYLGTAISGFPNLFTIYGPGTNVGHSSVLLMIEAQVGWVRQAVRRLRAGQGRVEVRAETQEGYQAWFAAASAGTVWESGCRSWYTVEGRNTNNWPASAHEFRRRMARFDEADLLGTELPAEIELPEHAPLGSRQESRWP